MSNKPSQTPMHGYPTKDQDYVCWYPLRRTVIIKCLVQEYNKTSPTALEPRPLDLETSALTMRPQRTTWPKLLKCIWQTFLICSVKSPQCTDKKSEKQFDSDFSSPYLMYQKRQISVPVRGKNHETKNRRLNECEIISGLKVSGKTDFSEIFLFSYKQLTFVPFPGESISLQKENDWEISFPLSLKSL